MKLETKLERLLPTDWPSFTIRFFELWREDGLSVNDSWNALEAGTREKAISLLRDRWEIFKLNYLKRARVSDLRDDGEDDTVRLEVDCTAFADITNGAKE